VTTLPIYDATAPIVCTVDGDEATERLALLERLRARLEAIDRTEHGLLLRFPADPDVEADVRRFAADEKGCCRFWGFAVSAADDELTLRWDAPPAAEDILASVEAGLRGDAPLADLGGLL
jgi:hypothetical protein